MFEKFHYKTKCGEFKLLCPELGSHKKNYILIFLHGVMADNNTWGRLPEFVARKLNSACPAFFFQYPAKFGQKTSIKNAASSLSTLLNIDLFEDFTHLVFITHSTGGLVLKESLAREQKILSEDVNPRFEKLISARTSLVFNITVPHFGGRRLLSYTLIPFLNAVSVTLKLPLDFLQTCCAFDPALGHNEIGWQLRWGNPYLRVLDDRFNKLRNQLLVRDFPSPKILEIRADNDQAVPPNSVTKSKFKLLDYSNFSEHSGNHFSIKQPISHLDPIVDEIAKKLDFYSDSAKFSIAMNSVRRISAIDREWSIDWQEYDEDQDSVSRFQSAVSGSQSKVYAELLKTLRRPKDRKKFIVLTGDGLVGKSTLLRRVTKKLSSELFSGSEHATCIPIYFPLKDLRLTNEIKNSLLFQLILDWCHWARINAQSDDISCDAVVKLVSNQNCVLILDGVDEILSRNNTLTIEMFSGIIDEIHEHFPNNDKLTILFGVRSSQKRLAKLLNRCSPNFEVTPLSKTQIRSLDRHQALVELIERVDDASAAALLGTPLAIVWLHDKVETLSSKLSKLNTAVVFEELLKAILLSRGLNTRQFVSADSSESCNYGFDTWLDAAALASSVVFVTFSSVFDAIDSNFKFSVGSEQSRKLLSTHSSRSALLESTVFIHSGADSYRIAHEEIETYLASRYLAICVREGNFEQLGERAFTPSMFKIAGEILRNYTISRKTIDSVISVWEGTQRLYVIANFCALLGHIRPKLAPDAFDLLEDKFAHLPVVAQIVLLTSTTHWMLSSNKTSTGTAENSFMLRRIGNLLTRCTESNVVDAVVRSFAWFGIQSLSNSFGIEVLGVKPMVAEWPRLTIHENHLTSALDVMAGEPSLQVAFTDIQRAPLVDNHRAIAAVHYLYYVCAVAYMGTPSNELIAELEAVFSTSDATGQKLEQIYKSHHLKPVYELFQLCKTIWSKAGTL